MKFFVDTAEVAEIADLAATGLLDGVTTNPSLIAKSGRNVFEVIKEICALVDGPVSAEVTATTLDEMLAEAEQLSAIAPNVCIKLPLIWDGLKACKRLSTDGVAVNVTLCFSAAQALLAAKAGASFISPFVGRLDDIGHDGMAICAEIVQIYENYGYATEVLVASVRHPKHVLDAAMMGADICTIPSNVFEAMFRHPLTDKGLAAFLADWEKAKDKVAAE